MQTKLEINIATRTGNLVADLPLRRVLVNILLTVLLCTTLKPNGNFSGNFFELDTRDGIEHLE